MNNTTGIRIYILLIFIIIRSTGAYAQTNTDSLTLLIRQSKNELEKNALQRQLIQEYINTKAFTKAEILLDSAIRLSRQSQNALAEADFLNMKGVLYRRTNQFILSKDAHIEALKIATIQQDTSLLASVNNNLGVTERRTSKYDDALKYHLAALKYAEDINDTKETATALNSLGIIFTLLKNYGKAEYFLKRALETETANDNMLGLAINHNTLGWLYSEQHKTDKALEQYQISICYNDTLENKTGIAICRKDIGSLYYAKGNYKEAEKNFNLALNYFKEVNDIRHFVYTSYYYAELLLDQKQYTKAQRYFEIAVKKSKEIKLYALLYDAYSGLSKLYEEKNNAVLALKYARKAAVYYDSIQTKESKKITKEIETKYKLENSRLEIQNLTEINKLSKNHISNLQVAGTVLLILFVILIILAFFLNENRRKLRTGTELLKMNNAEMMQQKEQIAKQKDILEKQTQELQITNDTKDKFFSIIAHDLRNPFSALLGLTEILYNDYGEYTDTERRELLRTTYQAAKKSHNLLENLLTWARAQSGGLNVEKTDFNINKALNETLGQIKLHAANKAIKINADLQENLSDIHADYNMIMTIIRNLLSNAIKFTPTNGAIYIKSYQENGNIKISVRDTGIGMSPDELDKLFKINSGFSKKGTNNESGTGLGLILCKEFADKNDAEIIVESRRGKGSIFCLSVNLPT